MKITDRVLLILCASLLLLIVHIFLPNIGSVLAKQNDFLIWFISGLIVFIASLKVLWRGSLTESPLMLSIIIFVTGWMGGSLFNEIYNLDFFSLQCIWLIGGVILWISLLQFELDDRQERILLSLIFVSAVIESLIGLIQFSGLYRYIPVTPSPAPGVVGGAFQQKNLFASWIATGTVISLYLITTPFFDNLVRKKKFLFCTGVFLLALNLAIAQSRTGIAGTIPGIVLVMLARKGEFIHLKKRLFIWLLILTFGLFCGFSLLYFQDRIGVERFTVKKITWFTDPDQTSYRERILMLKTSMDMFLEKPLTGQGFGNFPSLYAYYQAKNKKDKPSWRNLGGSFTHHPHNELALIVAESGILGLLGIAALLAGLMRFASKTGYLHAFKYLAFLTPFLFHMLVEYPLHNSVTHWFTFVLLFALATRHVVKETRVAISTRTKIALTTFFSCFFLLFSIYLTNTFVAYNRFVIWFTEYSEGKEARVENIEQATNNFYLRLLAKPMSMFAKAERAVRDIDQNTEFLNDFLNWSQREKRRLPLPQVFEYEAFVFLNLGIHYKKLSYFSEALKSVNEGLELYGNNEFLKKLKKIIFVEAVKTITERLKYQAGKSLLN